jgi:hypothetical protein
VDVRRHAKQFGHLDAALEVLIFFELAAKQACFENPVSGQHPYAHRELQDKSQALAF